MHQPPPRLGGPARGTRVDLSPLHDNLGEKDDHLPMGRGRIDFSRLFAYLKAERTRPPVVTLEAHRPDDVWESLECLERLWPW
jgi:sugar phosphate isomerase/epimerase